MKKKVFVYGSLKRGFHNHSILNGCKFIGIDFLPGTLLDLGSFPGLIPGKKPIEGEIFEVEEATVSRLDRLEGHPHFYQRKEAVTINAGERVIYYELQQVRADYPVVDSGVWKHEYK